MFQNIKKWIWELGAEKRGVFALLSAIMAVPILTVMAVAVDLGQFLVMKQRLQAAVDAAALSVGQDSTLSDSAASTQAQAFITANYPALSKIGALTSVTVTRSTKLTTITANATMTTNFLKIIGYSTLGITVNAQIAAALTKLELVLVLDNTGSMSSQYGSMTGIAGLKTAATTLVNTLFAGDPNGKYVKIGVVPFTANVNVGTAYANASWIDNTNRAKSMSQENIGVSTGTGLIAFASNLAKATGKSSWAWGGCVRQRTEPYDTQDVAPDPNTPATLFTPFFAPDEPDAALKNGTDDCSSSLGTFPNNYLCDNSCWSGTTTASMQTDQSCVTKYTSSPKVMTKNTTGGPNYLCTVQPIIRLTNNSSSILTEINAMQAYGSTVIPAGLMWGWHLLSPNGPFGDGVAYTDPDTIKAIILVTDGQNEVYRNNFNGSMYNAYGYAYVNSKASHLALISTGNYDVPDYNLDQKETQLCANIQAVTDAKGQPGRIRIYAIGFGSVINSSSLQLLKQCASSPEYYFYNPTSDELIASMQSIAIGLSQFRIAQ